MNGGRVPGEYPRWLVRLAGWSIGAFALLVLCGLVAWVVEAFK